MVTVQLNMKHIRQYLQNTPSSGVVGSASAYLD